MNSGFDFNLSDTSFFDLFCFICGESITDLGINLLDVRTSYMGLPLPDKLGHVIGNKYLIIVSKEDKVCIKCHNLINHLDELEYNLSKTKQRVIKLLELTHKLNSLVDKDFISCQSANDSNLNSSKFKTIEENTCKISEYESLPSECFNSNIFFTENLAPKGLAPQAKIIHGQLQSLNEKSMLVSNCHENEGLDSSADVYISDHIVGGNENNNLPRKEASFSDNIDSNNLFIDHIQEEVLEGRRTFVDKRELDIVKFDVKAENKRSCFSQLQFPTNEISQSTALEQKKGMCVITSEQLKDNLPRYPTKERIFVCKICDIPFPKPYLLSRHTRIHQRNSEKVQCPSCNLECHDHLHYLYHRKNEHDILKRLSCPLCNEQFLSNKELKNHIITAHEGEQFSCDKCGEKFKRLIQFENHKLYFHGNRNCRICGKHISSVVKLRQHENRHAWIDAKKLSCEVCGRVFKTPGGLRVHKVSHTGNYKYFCEFCGRGFMSSVILEEHKGVHTKEERYICDICGRKFVLYSTFHLHKQWHKDPFPFPCHICNKKFRYRSVRSNHIRRDHTGENPYKCHYCNADFLKSVTLKKHISTHTKEYPFSCSTCQKGFNQRRSLARHMARIHNDKSLLNEEPKKCQYKVILRPEEFPTDNLI